MSLDVYLTQKGNKLYFDSAIFIREDGQTKKITRPEWDKRFPGQEPLTIESLDDSEVYSANITHNLNRMAAEAGIYACLWRSEELGITQAKQLIEPLRNGLGLLKSKPDHFKAFNPKNDWGTYEGFVQFVEDYLAACQANPKAKVSVSR